MSLNHPDLLALFDTIKVATENMNQVLADETEAIRKADLDAMTEVTEIKKSHLDTLQQAQQALYQAINFDDQQNISVTVAIEHVINQAAPAERSRLFARWNDVRQLLANCYRQNAINGNAINVNLNHMYAIMRSIRRVDENSLTYNGLGKLG
ncbi:MAG: flagellar protein FlgN [Legionellales bacterium]|nr:flagellar protein FlgN [Legionellales bacterium]